MFLYQNKVGGEFGAHLMAKATEDLNPLRVQWLFERMTPLDCEALDVATPTKLLVTHCLVPPVR
jgi:DNA-directed RNA polymerase III subunit RPC1